MIYDEHNDAKCTLRLRVWKPEEDSEPTDGDCVLEQYADGFWWKVGTFDFMELAMKRAKDSSTLQFQRGRKARDQYRLVGDDKNPFAYFDTYEGCMYPGTGPAHRARSDGRHAASPTTV
jgi:hypothetical protein